DAATTTTSAAANTTSSATSAAANTTITEVTPDLAPESSVSTQHCDETSLYWKTRRSIAIHGPPLRQQTFTLMSTYQKITLT
ncbi:10242_t:CDS:2, partial [Paraglomus brasilianum]